MSKEDWLDLIDTLEENEMYTEARVIKEYCLPPTAEEVCEALEIEFKKRYEDLRVFYKETKNNEIDNIYNQRIEQTIYRKFIATFFYGREEVVLFNHIISSSSEVFSNKIQQLYNSVKVDNRWFNIPPSIIKMVCEFYEYQMKVGN